MDPNDSMELSTPIKRIRDLTLNSPRSGEKFLIDELLASQVLESEIFLQMVSRGYSLTISSKVLSELNSRAQEICKVSLPPNRRMDRKKRFLGIHRSNFSNMDLISTHYAAARARALPTVTSSIPSEVTTIGSPTAKMVEVPLLQMSFQAQRNLELNKPTLPKHEMHRAEDVMEIDGRTTPHNENKRNSTIMSLVTKRRRTLNGPEEVLNYIENQRLLPPATTSPLKVDGPSRLDPSPGTTPKLSPSRISPSRGSYNLAGLLQDPVLNENKENKHRSPRASPAMGRAPIASKPTNLSHREFLKPALPKKRQTSLEMAGVSVQSPGLPRKPSVPSLQKKPSVPTLQKKLSIPTLNKKSSIPTLNKKPSTQSLNKKPSIHDLRQNSAIPRKPSYDFHKLARPSESTTPTDLLSRRLESRTLSRKPSDISMRDATPSRPFAISPSRTTTSLSKPELAKKPSLRDLKYTVPEPFSLYNKPTVSSSQKSLKSLYDQPTISSLQKSLNKFQRFKNKFH